MKELDDETCRTFMRTQRLGTLALAKGGEAYAVPLFYAYDGHSIFFHSRHGEKDEFLDATGRGCFVVMDVRGDDDWTSVMARGRVERVSTNADADRAFKAIRENPFPPEFGVTASGVPLRSGKDDFLWMMKPDEFSGRASRSPVARHP